jgi:hypothetical protein
MDQATKKRCWCKPIGLVLLAAMMFGLYQALVWIAGLF